MKVRNVLVFPAGTEIGLEILNALKYCKEVRLFGAGQDILNHAMLAYPEYHNLPSIYEDNWLEELVSLCGKLSIDYIFPAYDDIIVALVRKKERIPAAIISSPRQACEITRSKSETYHRLGGVVRVPRVFTDSDQVNSFPVLVKPDKGQGSFGIRKVHCRDELLAAIADLPAAIICEYLPGEEYTVDCFSDRERGLLFAGGRVRRRTRNGISVNTRTVDLPEFKHIAQIIGQELGLHGAWFFQLKRAEDGALSLLEVAPRIAGSMATHRVSGINFPLLSIFEEERIFVSVKPNSGVVELDRALGNRYRHNVTFSTLYIDLDDTLIVNGEINIQAIKLVFQCINKAKKVILLTRHRQDIDQTLRKHRLLNLFDEIIHIGEEKKSSFINQQNAIFVDDSFAERMDVIENCNIPTFDCSMIEMITEQAEFSNGVDND